MKKAVITVLGYDRKGIIARVSDALYRHDANILDISQRFSRGFST
jgi:ACT domain-containing protein